MKASSKKICEAAATKQTEELDSQVAAVSQALASFDLTNAEELEVLIELAFRKAGPGLIEAATKKVGRAKGPPVTVEYMDQQIFLDRCIYFALKGEFVDPRTIGGAEKLFGSTKKLDEACTREGLTTTGYIGDATLKDVTP